MSSPSLRLPILAAAVAPLLLLALVAPLPGCGDDPASPRLLPDLAAADSASVTLHVLGAMEGYEGAIDLAWRDIDALDTPGAFADSNDSFHGRLAESGEYYNLEKIVHLDFDPRTGAIDSLYCLNSYSQPRGGYRRSVIAHAVPLTSCEEVDGRLQAVWRLEGVMTCACIDTLVDLSLYHPYELVTWSCAGDEEPYLEVRLWN